MGNTTDFDKSTAQPIVSLTIEFRQHGTDYPYHMKNFILLQKRTVKILQQVHC